MGVPPADRDPDPEPSGEVDVGEWLDVQGDGDENDFTGIGEGADTPKVDFEPNIELDPDDPEWEPELTKRLGPLTLANGELAEA